MQQDFSIQDLDVQTINTGWQNINTGKNINVIGHVDQLIIQHEQLKDTNRLLNAENRTDFSTTEARIIQAFSTEYYQLIVTLDEDVFDTNVVSVSVDRALEFVPPEISEKCSSLTDECIEKLKTFPAIICMENIGWRGETDPQQMAVYGYIRRVRKVKKGKDIEIAFKPIRTLQQCKMCTRKTAIYFDLNIDYGIETLKRCAWSIHKVNLFEAFDEAGMFDMPRPTSGES